MRGVVDNPERIIRVASRKEIEETNNKPKSLRIEEGNMTNVMNLKQCMIHNSESIGFGVRSTYIENLNFERKWQNLHLLKETPFARKDHEDTIQHVKDVIEIADYFNIPNASEDQVMLRVFLTTLIGPAKYWIKITPS